VTATWTAMADERTRGILRSDMFSWRDLVAMNYWPLVLLSIGTAWHRMIWPGFKLHGECYVG
jgi:hypothetical protein